MIDVDGSLELESLLADFRLDIARIMVAASAIGRGDLMEAANRIERTVESAFETLDSMKSPIQEPVHSGPAQRRWR